MFSIQESRYGDRWKSIESYDNLATALRDVEDREDFEGKYTYRLVDEVEYVYYESACPYEGVIVNIAQDDWMKELQSDYSIPDEIWKRACEYWLDHV